MSKKLKIHSISDLHREFSDYTHPAPNGTDVVILAGDIDQGCHGIHWAKKQFPDCKIIYLMGNHEYYGCNLVDLRAEAKSLSDNHLTVLDQDEVIIGQVRFLGATGWTDYESTGNSPMAELECQGAIKDFQFIAADGTGRSVLPFDFAERSRAAKQWFIDKLAEPFEGKTVVISHYAPSVLSLGKEFGITHLDANYANRWENMMAYPLPNGKDIALWVHGHTHKSLDYELYGTRIVCNPRGYDDGQNKSFNPHLLIEI
jgi:predicted phosphodiesterase